MLLGFTRSFFRMLPPPLLPQHHCPSVPTLWPLSSARCNYWLHSQFIVTWIRDKNSGRYIYRVWAVATSPATQLSPAPDNTEVARIRAALLRTSLPTTRGATQPGETLRKRCSRRLNGAAATSNDPSRPPALPCAALPPSAATVGKLLGCFNLLHCRG